MALKVSKGRELPTGAIRLDRDQAIRYQENRINNWKYPADTWYLRYGSTILGVGAGISSYTFLSYFWWKLRIGRGPLAFSFIPGMLIPGVTAAILNEKFLKAPLTIQEFTCPVCAEIRGSLLQLGAGIGQSYIMALLASISAANTTFSYPIPELKAYNPSKFVKFIKKICRDTKSRLLPVFILNMALSNYVTYKMNSEVLYLSTVEDGTELEVTFSEFQ